MSGWIRKHYWIGVAVFLFAGLSLSASTFIQRTLEEMCELSDEILQGTVVAKKSAYEPSGQIWTTYEIRLVDSLKSRASKASVNLTIKQIGGTVDGITMVAEGFPHFEIGQEVLLFTRDFGAGFQSVTNGSQGAWPVVEEATKNSAGTDVPSKSVPGINSIQGLSGGSDLESVKQVIRDTLKSIQSRKSKEAAK